MAITYKAIATTTVGAGGASSIDFTSIPATFTDICIKMSARGTSTAIYAKIKINNDSSAIYSLRTIYGEGSAGSASQSDSGATYFERFLMNSSAFTASTFSNSELYIPNYAGSNNKSMMFDSVNETNATAVQAYMVAGLYASTSAINQITLTPNTGNFAQYSTATLYGIKNS
jgi:hypothetical protein